MRYLRFIVVTFWSVLLLTSCQSRAYPPTHTATVNLRADQYSGLIEKLDTITSQFGIMKFENPRGLNEVLNRSVLFVDYRVSRESVISILTVHDVKGVSKVEVLVYLPVLKSLAEQEAFKLKVEEVLKNYESQFDHSKSKD